MWLIESKFKACIGHTILQLLFMKMIYGSAEGQIDLKNRDISNLTLICDRQYLIG